ncbi:(2Fe-2S)-binding protein [Agrobacterium fabrum]|uniref:(2Fe-2S)-binding protein n=1 Tax=Agrobacterium fabrum TaxID=1176649 RepID=UPI00191F4B1A
MVACQLLEAGATIVGIVETSPASNIARAMHFLWGAIRSPKLISKGLAMTMRLKRAGIAWFKNATDIRMEGEFQVDALTFCVHGRKHRLAADTVLLHHGVIPNTQISRLLRADHEWNDAQLAWQPCLDAFRETSVPGLRIAGDGGGIGGALAAEASGRLAVIGAAHALGRLNDGDRDRLAAGERKRIATQTRIRPFLDALYRPPQWLSTPEGDTVVCRCEEVTAADIRGSVTLGVRGPNQTKFYNRCGMGPCQGRMCGLTVTQVLADELCISPSEVGAYQVRSPLKPITLQQMATLHQTTSQQEKA